MMAAETGKCTVLALLSLSSACDTLDHSLLLNRLRELGLSSFVLGWLSSYLTDRCFNVFANPIFSETTQVSCGVPQSSVLGPIVFLLATLSLGKIISWFSNVSYHLYADYIQLCCSFKDFEFDKLYSFTV